ncbi:CoA-transferase family III [Acrodontium crateriforme]|uniref:CoA-transferase family III n=1 Tax=Acrodontium crateriforme TaxID=150365 RepID=A0AAQ3R732_9PEZI|nr:CoA-transferase family III [Acrodontium crateriforme]
MAPPPPLTGIRVLEFAGLAPGPFAGLLMADYGATVVRVDRAHPAAHSDSPPSATVDQLTRHKTSITVNTKTAAGVALIKSLIPYIDVVIDPFRPGVLERLGLGPENVMLKLNPRVVVARMTGFRRDGKYKDMAGHDINYIAVSGLLSLMGRKGEKPYPPGNVIGDFAGGGAVCFMGILLALMQRERTGAGQVVEANMVDGSAYLASFPRFNLKKPQWDQPRGENILDGGNPFYDTYETKDRKFMSVGALEPQFFAALLKGLEIKTDSLGGDRMDRKTWPKQREIYTKRFKEKTRKEWEAIFDGTDACCTPVLTHDELEADGFDQRPIVTLRGSPGFAIAKGSAEQRPAAEGQGAGVEGEGWSTEGLRPGVGGEEVLAKWTGWKRGRHYQVKDGGLELVDQSKL